MLRLQSNNDNQHYFKTLPLYFQKLCLMSIYWSPYIFTINRKISFAMLGLHSFLMLKNIPDSQQIKNISA